MRHSASPSLEQLREASTLSQIRKSVQSHIYAVHKFHKGPFFSQRDLFDVGEETDSDDGELDSDNEEDNPGLRDVGGTWVEGTKGAESKALSAILPSLIYKSQSPGAWFKQPKYMPNWLYTYFGEVVKPLITMKEKRQLSMPPSFADNGILSPPSFWIYPPEPAILLSRRRFDPTLFYRPRIFLWLPHFLVEDLHCPTCKTAILEKNGALRPRRIVDSQDCFYPISWAYYCRKGCKSHFAGWGHAVLDSLPRHLRLAFPAILSH